MGVSIKMKKKTIEVTAEGTAVDKEIIEMKEVVALGSGNSFGELALLYHKPRAATITCKEDCHFAVLEKDAFNEILSRVLSEVLKEYRGARREEDKSGSGIFIRFAAISEMKRVCSEAVLLAVRDEGIHYGSQHIQGRR